MIYVNLKKTYSQKKIFEDYIKTIRHKNECLNYNKIHVRKKCFQKEDIQNYYQEEYLI